MSDLITQIEQARFTPVRLRSGYDMGEVDQLLDEIVAALSAGRPVEPLIDGARITTVSFREGYDMAEVDALHDPGSPVPPPAPVSPTTSGVVEEQQGLLSRLFGRRSG
jgi:DivIVA domain-containing protein